MSDTSHTDGRITTDDDGTLFTITFDRPDKSNGFTPAMLAQLAEAYTAFERQSDCRVALVCAEGRNFTGGLDLPLVKPHMDAGRPLFPPGTVDPFGLRPPARTKPVVVAVQGWCLTLGIELMLAADIVVAADDARFAQIEVQRGLMATGGATIRMVERAGWGNAMVHLLTGDPFDAQTAFRLGYVQELVAAEQVRARAQTIARRIAEQAPLAVRATLASARRAVEHGPEAAIALFNEIQHDLLRSEDAAEGLRAFQERRSGRFLGR